MSCERVVSGEEHSGSTVSDTSKDRGEREMRLRAALAHVLSRNDANDPRIAMLSAVALRVMLEEAEHDAE